MIREGIAIEFLAGGYWRDDRSAGAFELESAALDYLQAHLDRYPNTVLRISTHLYHVRADGLYKMSARGGWKKFEGVRE